MNKLTIKKVFSGFGLKLICLLMLIIGRALVELNAGEFLFYAEQGWTVPAGTVTLMKLGYNIYYIGVPIACFLLVEGCMKTSSIGRFIVRLAAAAIITEMIFDYSKVGLDQMFDFSHGIQKNSALNNTPNFFFTLLLGLICIALMEHLVAKKLEKGSLFFNLFNLLIVLFGVVGSYFLGLEHGGSVVMMIFVFYFFYDNPFLTVIGIAILQIVMLGNASGFFMYTPVVGTFITWFYNGKKGNDGKFARFITYAAYPIAYITIVIYLRKTGVIQ